LYKLLKASKALSDNVRLRIINLLLKRECCVCEVMQALNISQTRASRNLNMLYDAGFLKLRKEGLWSFFSIDKENNEKYLSLLTEAVEEGLRVTKTPREIYRGSLKLRRWAPAAAGWAKYWGWGKI